MRIRRCAVLWLEPRELVRFDLAAVLAGGTGVVTRQAWLAHVPHLPEPLELSAADAMALGSLGPDEWVASRAVSSELGPRRFRSFLEKGLVIANSEKWSIQRQRDEEFRALHWHGLAAVWHARSRWSGADAAQDVADAGVGTSAGLRARHGLPPPTFLQEPAPRRADIALPRLPRDSFDGLLDARSSCRNFDPRAVLNLDAFSQLMERVFGARDQVAAAEDFDVIKRTSPSGGALHPTECYLLVQRVQGVRAGLYHYDPGRHRLRRITAKSAPPLAGETGVAPLSAGARSRWLPRHWRQLAKIAVAGQDYFADAAVLCVMAPRFTRNFWKYRNHPKAYRVAILDAGHLSQTLQLCATQAGLGGFVTAAINEVDIERVLGLQPHVSGPLLVCGFGPRATHMRTSELDPAHLTWNSDGELHPESARLHAARGKPRSSRR